MTEQLASFSPDWISPPGDTIADLLEERGWTQSELAERTGFTTKHVSLLINGKAPITEDTALRLERVVGSSARFWLTREAHYRAALARSVEEKNLKKDAGWLDDLPIKDMVRFGWIEKRSSKAELVSECFRFFGVASVQAWRNSYLEPIAAFRASKAFAKNRAAVSAWLRQGEKRADEIRCKIFDKTAFKAALDKLRGLTNESAPEAFVPNLRETCAAVGVAVIFEPAPKGCPVSGATKWLSQDKALLMLSLRHRSSDHLWFSFFHEAGHLILHGKKMMFIEMEGVLDEAHEREADKFASDCLIPSAEAQKLRMLPPTVTAVREFASRVGVAPGIVVGRMQKEGRVPWNRLNELKARYRWAHDEDAGVTG